MAYSKSTLRSFLLKAYLNISFLLEKFVGPLLFLLIRLWMAQIFWHSGLSKIQSWSTTLLLFKNEYKVPYLSPEVAAYLAAATELSCPILLLLGLASRFAVIPMLIMVGVIQLTYVQSTENFYWAIFLGLILCYGAGPLSLDFFFRKQMLLKEKNKKIFKV